MQQQQEMIDSQHAMIEQLKKKLLQYEQQQAQIAELKKIVEELRERL